MDPVTTTILVALLSTATSLLVTTITLWAREKQRIDDYFVERSKERRGVALYETRHCLPALAALQNALRKKVDSHARHEEHGYQGDGLGSFVSNNEETFTRFVELSGPLRVIGNVETRQALADLQEVWRLGRHHSAGQEMWNKRLGVNFTYENTDYLPPFLDAFSNACNAFERALRHELQVTKADLEVDFSRGEILWRESFATTCPALSARMANGGSKDAEVTAQSEPLEQHASALGARDSVGRVEESGDAVGEAGTVDSPAVRAAGKQKLQQ